MENVTRPPLYVMRFSCMFFLWQLPCLERFAIFRIRDPPPLGGYRIEFRSVASKHVATVARHYEGPNADVVELSKSGRGEGRAILALRRWHEPLHPPLGLW